MKRIIFLLLATPLVSSAATLALSTETGEVHTGEQVSVVIGVDTGEERIVTVKASLSYPPELLELVSFSFASEAFALSQPGYDAEGAGTLVKTAGFPGGFTGAHPFGTAVFRARAAGTATISLSSLSGESLLLNTQGVNRLTKTTELTLAVTAPTVSLPPAPLPQSAELTPALGTPAPSFVSATIVPTTTDQVAAIGVSAFWKSPLVLVLFSLLAVGVIAGLAWYTMRQ